MSLSSLCSLSLCLHLPLQQKRLFSIHRFHGLSSTCILQMPNNGRTDRWHILLYRENSHHPPPSYITHHSDTSSFNRLNGATATANGPPSSAPSPPPAHGPPNPGDNASHNAETCAAKLFLKVLSMWAWHGRGWWWWRCLAALLERGEMIQIQQSRTCFHTTHT